MAMELECGSCSRRIHVEAGEGIVVCPHCETALQIPEDAQAAPSANGDGLTLPAVAAAESATHVEAESVSQFAFLETADHDTSTPPDSSVFPGFPIGEDGPTTEGNQQAGVATQSAAADKESPAETPLDFEPAAQNAAEDTVEAEPASRKITPVAAPASDAPRDEPQIVTSRDMRPPARGVPLFLFVMLAGYASAVTIALIWLWWTRGRVHPLESLPDLQPKTAAYLIDESAPLPPGHTLHLGDTRRFGNLEVTPLHVTRGPARIVSASDDGEDAGDLGLGVPVLKLWLRIRNVSNDQTFRPFGRELLRLPANSASDRFNTFVCRTDQKRKDGDRVVVYHLTREERDLALLGQQADKELPPHDSYETYIASSDRGIDDLTGDLVWRVHFRKGLNAKSGRGVTTLIEVAFNSNAVVEESRGEDVSGE